MLKRSIGARRWAKYKLPFGIQSGTIRSRRRQRLTSFIPRAVSADHHNQQIAFQPRTLHAKRMHAPRAAVRIALASLLLSGEETNANARQPATEKSN